MLTAGILGYALATILITLVFAAICEGGRLEDVERVYADDPPEARVDVPAQPRGDR